MTEENQQQANLPDLELVIQGIGYGEYDGHFDQITQALAERRAARQQDVMAQVREVFGDDAEVKWPERGPLMELFKKTKEERAEERKNPFVEKRNPPPVDEKVWDAEHQPPEEVEPPTLDPLAETDPKIGAINSGEQLPFEQRGAIVGGLSAGDIGE